MKVSPPAFATATCRSACHAVLQRRHEALIHRLSSMTTSRMLEGYCTDIEHLLRESSVHPALRLALALPDICSALEHPLLERSPRAYAQWCGGWLKLEAMRTKKAVDGLRLHRLHLRSLRSAATESAPGPGPGAPLLWLRLRRSARTPRALDRPRLVPSTSATAFRMQLCEALVQGARRWYRRHGVTDGTVQQNLGKLLLTR